METENITTKIISILIPLILLVVVLVPICNQLGGSDESADVGIIEGNRVSLGHKSDLDFPINYTYSDDIVPLHPVFGSFIVEPTFYKNNLRTYTVSASMPNITIYYDSNEGGPPFEDVFFLDPEGEYIAQSNERPSYSTPYERVKLSSTEKQNLVYASLYVDHWLDLLDDGWGLDINYYFQYNLITNGWELNWSFEYYKGEMQEDEETYDGVHKWADLPKLSLNTKGEFKFNKNLQLLFGGQSFDIDLNAIDVSDTASNIVRWNAIYHVPSENTNGNGTLGTLIQMIPIFVALGLITAIVVPMISARKQNL